MAPCDVNLSTRSADRERNPGLGVYGRNRGKEPQLRDEIRRVRQYELMTIFVPELPEEELQAEISRVNDILTGAGGTVSIINREAPWGRRRLAYPIRHGGRDVRDGFYALYYTELDAQAVQDVERDLKLMDNLMRYLITQQVAEAMVPQSDADAEEERAAEEAAAAGIIPGGMVSAPAEGAAAGATGPEEAAATDSDASETTETGSESAPSSGQESDGSTPEVTETEGEAVVDADEAGSAEADAGESAPDSDAGATPDSPDTPASDDPGEAPEQASVDADDEGKE